MTYKKVREPAVLPPAMIKDIRQYLAIRKAASLAGSAYQRNSKAATEIKDKIVSAMKGRVNAMCGNVMVDLKTIAAVPAKITLLDGTEILWSDISEISVGDEKVALDEVEVIYGGRGRSTSLIITKV